MFCLKLYLVFHFRIYYCCRGWRKSVLYDGDDDDNNGWPIMG